MTFTKGQKKLANSGRKKGTPNKKTLLFVDELGNFKTVKELIDIFYSTDKDELKVQICFTLLKYQYPQRKAIDINTEDTKLPTININGFKI